MPRSIFESLERRTFFSIVAKLVEIPISAAAKVADPILRSHRSFDLHVRIGAGDKWLSGGVFVSLSHGRLYSPPDFDKDQAQPEKWKAHPNLKFDTFVSSSNFLRAAVGGFYATGGAPRRPEFSATRIDVTWFNPHHSQFGRTMTAQEFTIGRFTLSSDAVGAITGEVGGLGLHGVVQTRFFTAGAFGAASIGGQFFNDIWATRKWDSASGLSGWRVFIDTNNNGVLDTNEPSTLTNGAGAFYFTSLKPGAYVIRFVHQKGWQTTTAWSQLVTLAAGQQRFDLLFGEHRIS